MALYSEISGRVRTGLARRLRDRRSAVFVMGLPRLGGYSSGREVAKDLEAACTVTPFDPPRIH